MSFAFPNDFCATALRRVHSDPWPVSDVSMCPPHFEHHSEVVPFVWDVESTADAGHADWVESNFGADCADGGSFGSGDNFGRNAGTACCGTAGCGSLNGGLHGHGKSRAGGPFRERKISGGYASSNAIET